MRRLLAAAALIAAAPAWAAQPAPPPAGGRALDPAALAAARELLEATQFNRQFEQSARLTAQTTFVTVITALEQRHGADFPDALERELQAIVEQHIDGTIAILLRTALDDTARVYARFFTAEEIRELQRLQTHPVMIRYQQVAPQFMAELVQIGVPTDLARMPELMRRIDEAVQAWVADQALHEPAPAT